MGEIHNQLVLFGLDKMVEEAISEGKNRKEVQRIVAAHRVLSLEDDDNTFLHAGFAMAGLPHSKPEEDLRRWKRSNGRFHLVVSSGSYIRDGQIVEAGIPYGSRARLILLYLMTEAVQKRSRMINLGGSMTAWIRKLGLSPNGGKSGNIGSVRDQATRISRAGFTFQWDDEEGSASLVRDKQILDGTLHLWAIENDRKVMFPQAVELTQEFYDHLVHHAVPLNPEAIAFLKGSSLGLDLYFFLAHRLHRLSKPLQLRWSELAQQFGSDYSSLSSFAFNMRKELDDVLAVYPEARVESTRSGLVLMPSKAAVPTNRVQVLLPEKMKLDRNGLPVPPKQHRMPLE